MAHFHSLLPRSNSRPILWEQRPEKKCIIVMSNAMFKGPRTADPYELQGLPLPEIQMLALCEENINCIFSHRMLKIFAESD